MADGDTTSDPLSTLVNQIMAQSGGGQLQPPPPVQTDPHDLSFTGLLGTALGGGLSGAVPMTQQERQAAGGRALLDFGLNLMAASGPSLERRSVGQILAQGLSGAGQSLAASESTAAQMQAAQQDWALKQQQMRMEALKTAMPLLQAQYQQQLAAQAGRTLLGQGTAPGGGGDFNTFIIGKEGTGTSKTSTASGIGQFLESTWGDFVKANPSLFAGMTQQQILDARNNPDIANKAITWLANNNAATLANAGVAPTGPSLGIAHRLGAGAAIKVMQAPDNTPISSLVSADAVKANPELGTMTVGDMKKRYASTPTPGFLQPYKVASTGPVPPPPSGTTSTAVAPPPTPAQPTPAGGSIPLQSLPGVSISGASPSAAPLRTDIATTAPAAAPPAAAQPPAATPAQPPAVTPQPQPAAATPPAQPTQAPTTPVIRPDLQAAIDNPMTAEQLAPYDQRIAEAQANRRAAIVAAVQSGKDPGEAAKAGDDAIAAAQNDKLKALAEARQKAVDAKNTWLSQQEGYANSAQVERIKAGTEIMKSRDDAAQKQVDAYVTRMQPAQDLLNNIDVLKQVLPTLPKSAVPYLQDPKYADILSSISGFLPPDWQKAVDSTDMFQRVIGGMITSMAANVPTGQPAGREAAFEQIRSMLPSLSQTAEGREQVLMFMESLAKRKIAEGNFMQRYQADEKNFYPGTMVPNMSGAIPAMNAELDKTSPVLRLPPQIKNLATVSPEEGAAYMRYFNRIPEGTPYIRYAPDKQGEWHSVMSTKGHNQTDPNAGFVE